MLATPSTRDPDPVLGGSPPAGWRAGTLTYTAGGLALLFALLLVGDFAWSLKERGVAPVFQVELRRQGASDLLVGMFLGAIPSLISILVTPVVGVLSDRARTRWGRRIPFLALPTPLIALGLVGMACTTDLATHLQPWTPGWERATVILVLYGVLWTVFEVATLVANAVFHGLVNDVVPAALIGRFFGLFRAVSLGAGIIFNTWIIGHAEEAFRIIILGIAAVYVVGITVMCLFVREGAYPSPPPWPTGGPRGAVRGYLGQTLRLGYYRRIFVAVALGAVAFLPVNTFSIFAATSYGLTVEQYGRWMAGAFVVSLVIAYPMGAMADRLHPLRIGAVALAVYLVALLVSWALVDSGTGYGIAFAIHVVISGAFFSATASLGMVLFPRLQFSQFAAAATIATSLATMVLSPLAGRILDLTGRDYRLTFLMGALITATALVVWIVVWRQFCTLNGPQGYTPPEPGQLT